jgi:hypothetical protein
MSGTPIDPEPGDVVIDATPLKSYLVDLPPGALAGTRSEQEGFDDVFAEMVSNQTDYGTMAGIPATDIQELQETTEKINRLRKYRRAVDKLGEQLAESEGYLDNRRHQIISSAAASVDRRARRDGQEVLLAKYQKTRAYRSAAAFKAARTRRLAEAGTPPTRRGRKNARAAVVEAKKNAAATGLQAQTVAAAETTEKSAPAMPAGNPTTTG